MVGSKKYPGRSMGLPPAAALAPWARASATSSVTRANWGALLMGPSLLAPSVPSPTDTALARLASASTTSSYICSGT